MTPRSVCRWWEKIRVFVAGGLTAALLIPGIVSEAKGDSPLFVPQQVQRASSGERDTTSAYSILQKQFARIAQVRWAARRGLTGVFLPSYGDTLRFWMHPAARPLPPLPVSPGWQVPAWQEDFIKRRSGGILPMTVNPALLYAAIRPRDSWERSRRTFRNDFVPSNLQLHVLRFLWEEGIATQSDIYASLDTLYPITAELLNRQLERMLALGLVERKLISPQNLFTFISPIKIFQIEMSAKNRKNRVYLYRPRVDRRTILRFLLSRSYWVKENGGNKREQKRLQEKLRILLGPGFME